MRGDGLNADRGDGLNVDVGTLRAQLEAAVPPEAHEERRPEVGFSATPVSEEAQRAVLAACGCGGNDPGALQRLSATLWAVPEFSEDYSWPRFAERLLGGNGAELSERDRGVLARIRWLQLHPELVHTAADYWKHGRWRPSLDGSGIPACPAEAKVVWRETNRRLRLDGFKDQVFELEGRLLSLLGASAGLVLGAAKRLNRLAERADELLTRARARIDHEDERRQR